MKLTPQSVSAVLKKAGFPRSEWRRSGQVRGWGHSTAGFSLRTEYAEKTVTKWAPPTRWRQGQTYKSTAADRSKVLSIRVEWIFGDWHRGDVDVERPIKLRKLKEALESAGYAATIVTKGNEWYADTFIQLEALPPCGESLVIGSSR